MAEAIDTSDIPEAGEEWFGKARMILPHWDEVKNARAHLLKCQDFLSRCRRARVVSALTDEATAGVLAALSWVWDAQERAGLNRDILTPMRMGPGLVVMFNNRGARGDG